MATDLLERLAGLGMDYARAEGVTIHLKTDLGPEVKIYDSRAQTSGPAAVQAGVVIRDQKGAILGQVGGYPKTNPVKMLAAGVLVAGIGWLLLRGIMR